MSREVTTASRNPDSGLMVSVTFLLILVPLAYSHFVFDSGLLPKFLGMMVGALPVAACWAKMEFRGETVRTRLLTDLPIYLYTLIVVLQWPRALDVHQASLEVVKVLTYVIIYMAITRCSVEAHWQVWTTTFVLVTFVVSLVGIAQYFGLAFLSLPSSGLPSSTFVYRNTVAMFLITALPFSFLKFAQADVGRREIFWAVSWTTICTFLIYTRTRGAWVGCLGSLIVVLALIGVRYRLTTLNPRRILKVFRSRKAVVLFCSLMVLAAAGSIDPSRVTTTKTQPIPIPEEKDSVSKALDSIVSSVVVPANTVSRGRVWWWRSTFEMITDHPWIGVGLTNWEKIYPTYKAKELWAAKNRLPRRPHNDYLWVWAELGTLGFIAYLGMFIFLAYAAVSSARSLNLESYGLVIAALAGIVAIQGHSLFSFPKERVGPMLGEWFCISLLASAYCGSRVYRDIPKRISASVAAVVLVVLGGVIVAQATASAAMSAIGIMLHREDRTQEALLSIRESRRYGVFDYRHLMYHTEIYATAGQLESAYDSSKEVMRRNPNSASGHRNLLGIVTAISSAYERDRDFDKAIENYETARSHSPPHWVPFQIGKIHLRKEDYDIALTYFAESLSHNDFSQGHFAVGSAYIKLGKTDEAMEAYQRGLAQAPRDPAAHYAVGILYLNKGLGASAVDHLQKVLKWSKNEALRIEVNSLLREVSDEGS